MVIIFIGYICLIVLVYFTKRAVNMYIIEDFNNKQKNHVNHTQNKIKEDCSLSPGTGWCGPDGGVITNTTYPKCLRECKDDPECSYVRWVVANKQCNLMRECPNANSDPRWRHQKVSAKCKEKTIDERMIRTFNKTGRPNKNPNISWWKTQPKSTYLSDKQYDITNDNLGKQSSKIPKHIF